MSEDNIFDANFTEIDETEIENDNSDKIIRGEPLFFTTTQVATLVGEEPSTIRYWTKRFGHLLDIEISNKNRQYKKTDVEKLKFIKKLAKEDGLTLQQIDDYCSSKGFDLEKIEKGVLDGNNPIAIQAFLSALTVEMDKKLEVFSTETIEKINKVLENYLLIQAEMNEKLQENIVTTVDEVVTEKLDTKLEDLKSYIDTKELEAKQRDEEKIALLKSNMEERKKASEQLEKEKSKGLFSKFFKK